MGIIQSLENMEQLSDKVISARGGDISGVCISEASAFYGVVFCDGHKVLVWT